MHHTMVHTSDCERVGVRTRMASSLEQLLVLDSSAPSSEPGSPIAGESGSSSARGASKRRPPSARSSGRLDGLVLGLSKSSPPTSSEEVPLLTPRMLKAVESEATGAANRPDRPSSPVRAVPFNLDASPSKTPSPLSIPSFSRPPSNVFVPGKLNAASSSEKAGALPPSRRGASYSATKAKNMAQTQKSSSMQVISALNRPSHYERYGTIELLLNIGEESELLQLLKAEGYDCLLMEPSGDETTGDLVQVFNSKDVYPDVILMDCDHPSSSTAVIRNLQAQQPLASIICIGAVDSKLDAISCLQAGAVDYLRKPLDAEKQEELLARIERHVARQHGSKVSIEAALSEARAIIFRMEQVSAAAAASNVASLDLDERAVSFSSTGPLGAVAENVEYEDQAVEIAGLQSQNEELKRQIEELTSKLKLEDC